MSSDDYWAGLFPPHVLREYAMIADGERGAMIGPRGDISLMGAPKFTESQVLPSVGYADFAESLGLQGIAVDQPGQIGPAWDRALAASRPTVLDVRTSPDVPPIPPHATLEQATNAAEAMLKGDENRLGVLVEGIRTKAQEFLPHHEQ